MKEVQLNVSLMFYGAINNAGARYKRNYRIVYIRLINLGKNKVNYC